MKSYVLTEEEIINIREFGNLNILADKQPINEIIDSCEHEIKKYFDKELGLSPEYQTDMSKDIIKIIKERCK